MAGDAMSNGKSASVYERVRFTWTENAQTFELVPRSLTFAKHYRETPVTADCRQRRRPQNICWPAPVTEERTKVDGSRTSSANV
jgi:hypothetical protein